MRSRIRIIAVLFILLVFCNANIPAEEKVSMPWDVGEKLTFSIRWGMITCGYSHMDVAEKINLGGRETFRIVVLARSAPFFDPFYKVRDRIESYIDAEELHTVRYQKKQREGGYRKEVTIIYDHNHGAAYENGKKFEVPYG
ncbi:DUF3108 domain-containing protein, partial [Elusimicrobiota bacterium]